MSVSLMIHRVLEIKIAKKPHTFESKSNCLNIKIRTKDGYFDIALFSDNIETLKIHSN